LLPKTPKPHKYERFIFSTSKHEIDKSILI